MIKGHLFILLVIFSCVFSSEEPPEYTDADFDTSIKEAGTALVMFYAPWCGHCKRLKPEFAKAYIDLRNADPPITLAKVDCTEGGQDTCTKFSVAGYPTLKIFKNGELSTDYKGPREAKGIVEYMKKQVGPPSKELHTYDDYKKHVDSSEATILGLFEEDSKLKEMYLKFSETKRDKYKFAHTKVPEVLQELNERDGVILFRPKHLKSKFESPHVKFEGSTVADLGRFIEKVSHGLCGHRTRENAQDFKNPLIVVYYDVDYVKNPKGTNYWRNRVLKVAKEFEGRINFAISAQHDFQHEINEYGIDYLAGNKPLVVARDAKNRKYIMKTEFSPENIREFATQLEAGQLEPYIKSEEIPETNDAPVKVAVAKNFEEVVINNGKDTLVEFYAPWCGHCKKLSPVYDEVASKLENEDVVLVKMDATANDVPPEFEVRGFPTLYWLPKDSKNKPVAYDGGREVDDFIKFISKRATDELKGWDRSGKSKKIEL